MNNHYILYYGRGGGKKLRQAVMKMLIDKGVPNPNEVFNNFIKKPDKPETLFTFFSEGEAIEIEKLLSKPKNSTK